MSWFDEQIRLRMQRDEESFSNAIMEAAGTVLGRKTLISEDSRLQAQTALEGVLGYYRLPFRELPSGMDTLEEQMEYELRPHSIMQRGVELKKGWYKDAVGVFLGFRKEDGMPVAMYPSFPAGYYYYDAAAGRRVRIGRKNEDEFRTDAYAFYQSFPQKKLGIPDLIHYIVACLRIADIIMVALGSLAVVLITMIMPKLTTLLYGVVLESKNTSVLSAMAVFMASASISFTMISVSRDMITGCVKTRLARNVDAAVMLRVLSLPAGFFRGYSSGEISSRATAVSTLCNSLVDAFLSTGLTSLVSLLYITQIFEFAPSLVIPSVMIILATVAMSTLTMFMEMKRQQNIMEQNAKETGMAFSLVKGIQKIRLSGAEKRTFAHWAEQYNKCAGLLYNPPVLIVLNGVIATALRLGGTIILYTIAVKTHVPLKDYQGFNAAYGNVSGAFTALISMALIFARIKPVFSMAQPIMEAVPETGERKEMLTKLNGNIELDNISFRYKEDGPLIADELSLHIRSGDYVALVGPTGCGKSTLVRLMLGFEKPQKGSIYYDGKDLEQIDLRSLRRKIGTVMQDGSLFNNDIYANIAISAPGLTLDEAWEAAETACIADDIRAMPMGMFTMISEGQGGISGGQKQRLMIARAIAPKPGILIFDEATSALDNIAQKKVTEALDKLHCTRIVIAHRLSTIRCCNRILYLGGGKILEEGTYEELIAKNGLFADMVARQQL